MRKIEPRSRERDLEIANHVLALAELHTGFSPAIITSDDRTDTVSSIRMAVVILLYTSFAVSVDAIAAAMDRRPQTIRSQVHRYGSHVLTAKRLRKVEIAMAAIMSGYPTDRARGGCNFQGRVPCEQPRADLYSW